MAEKRTSKRVKRTQKKGGVVWHRLAAVLLVLFAFAAGLIYAGGCGTDKKNEPVKQSPAGVSESGNVEKGSEPAKQDSGKNGVSGNKESAPNNKDSKATGSSAGTNEKPLKKTVGKPGPAGRMAIIIDDCGYSASVLSTLANIDCPLTFSVLPYLGASNVAIAKANAGGKEIMLHLPMQSASGASPEKINILTSMSDSEIGKITRNAINAVPGARGVNNHQGSKSTADARVMRAVMSVVSGNGMFFVDSRTNPASVACDAAREYGVPTGANELFLDNSDSVSYVKGQIRKAIELARNHTIIVIGHARPNTAQAIAEMTDEIRGSNITLIFASEAVS